MSREEGSFQGEVVDSSTLSSSCGLRQSSNGSLESLARAVMGRGQVEGRIRNRQKMRLVQPCKEGERAIKVGAEEKNGGPRISDECIGLEKGFLQWQERRCILKDAGGWGLMANSFLFSVQSEVSCKGRAVRVRLGGRQGRSEIVLR